jgi:hypothetical protein
MESTNYPRHPFITRFQLNPIEAKSPRRFKHVSLFIPLSLSADTTAELRKQQVLSVQNHVLQKLSEAVALWPILSGSIRVVCYGKKGGQLAVQAPKPIVPVKQRSDLMNIEYRLSDPIQAHALLLESNNNKILDEILFPVGRTLGAGVPPLLLKLLFFDDHLVLVFSCHEMVADNKFISLVLSSMVNSTCDYPRKGRVRYYGYRPRLKPDQDASPGYFGFYDCSDKPIAQRTPSNQLVSQVVEFQQHAVLAFIRKLREYHVHCGNNKLDIVEDKDIMVAILWAAITRARHSLGKVQPCDQRQMNLLLPGGPQAVQNRPWSHFGNFTVPTVARASVLGISDEAADVLAPYRNSYYQDYILGCDYGIHWISRAAEQIREAIDVVKIDYVRSVMGAKKKLSAEEDSAAYERGIDRSTTGTTFEDWTDFYRSGRSITGIPFTDRCRFIQILPCPDDLEEGKIILLSHFKEQDGGHCQTRRLAWLCLETETMKLAQDQLEAEGWIKTWMVKC